MWGLALSWLSGFVGAVFSRRLRKHGIYQLNLLACILCVVGGVGFWGTALARTGQLNWLAMNNEWPIMETSRGLELSDGGYVVPVGHASRVQIYDPHWDYVTGWYIRSSGGAFWLNETPERHIRVWTARGNRDFLFDARGNLLSSSTYSSEETIDKNTDRVYKNFELEPWLILFASPGLAISLIFLGFIAFSLSARISKAKPNQST